MKSLLLPVVLLALCASPSLADDSKPAPAASAKPKVPEEGVVIPAWLIGVIVTAASGVATGAAEVMRRLYNRATTLEQELLVRYEGDPSNPLKVGILPALREEHKTELEGIRSLHKTELESLRSQHESEKEDLRTQAGEWRSRYEASETARREDSERFRQSELENLRVGMSTLQDVGSALQGNTRELHELVMETKRSNAEAS